MRARSHDRRKSGRVLNRAPAGEYPDGLAYDSAQQHVFISDESGGVETVITKPATGSQRSRSAVRRETSSTTPSGHIFADVQTRNEIAVIDPRKNRIVRRISVPGCSSDHGLLIDSARRLAFVACDGNARLLTLDLRTMKFTGNSSVGGSPDVLSLDSSLHRLYVSAESGVVAVFAETAHGARKLGQAMLATEAHTVAADPRTHLVYFPLQAGSAGTPQLLIMRPSR